MADQPVATWKLCHSEGFDEYMQSLGVPFATRKTGAMMKPNVIISKDGYKMCIETESTFKSTQIVDFQLGEEFDETTADDRKTKATITCENDALVQRQKWGNKETTIRREVQDGKLVVTCTMADVKCIRTYK